jgi:hypothetical protein
VFVSDRVSFNKQSPPSLSADFIATAGFGGLVLHQHLAAVIGSRIVAEFVQHVLE